jgi:RES domain-containing protein
VIKLWRLTSSRHARSAFNGLGAKANGGRWNAIGTPMVYLSQHLSLCALEVLVHANPADLPDFVSIPVEAPDGVSLEVLDYPARLSKNWRDELPPAGLRAFGDAWVKEGRSLLLQVPSVLIPEELNYLLNPLHPEVDRLVFGPPRPFSFDPRLTSR